MKAYWWFQENKIAGMARPGFNLTHWFDLPFQESAVYGWIGRYSSGTVPLAEFRHHLQTYVPQIFRFHKMDSESGPQSLEVFQTNAGFMGVLKSLNEHTQVLSHFEVVDDQLHFEMNRDRLKIETEYLKDRGITRVVSLTEHHHNKDFLGQHFGLHHLAIADLGAPRREQAQELAEIIKDTAASGEGLAVHCLAGIGRTSTMLIAAHLLMGEDFHELSSRIKKQNPSFVLTGSQENFIRALG